MSATDAPPFVPGDKVRCIAHTISANLGGSIDLYGRRGIVREVHRTTLRDPARRWRVIVDYPDLGLGNARQGNDPDELRLLTAEELERMAWSPS